MIHHNQIHKLTVKRRNRKKCYNPSYFKIHRVTMISIILKGGSILAIGENDYERKSYAFKNKNGYKQYQGLHSELAAINKCTKEQLKGSTIIIYGLGGEQVPYSTKPCEHCLHAIKDVGIKTIIYYEHGEQKKLRVSSLL
jgi:deoxycytidylate deaminase